MAKRKEFVDLVFPVGGLNEATAYDEQPSRTSASCQNVRAFHPSSERLRGAQRHGVVKHVSTQVNGSHEIQLVDHIVGDYPPPTGVGISAFGRNTGAGTGYATLVSGTGSEIATVGTAGEEYEGSIWTPAGVCILASRDGSTIKLLAVDTTGATSWTNDTAITGGAATVDIAGMGIFEDILYIWTDENEIHRFATSTGVKQEAGVWFTTTIGTPPQNIRNAMAIANGVICVIGGGGSGKKIQIIDISTVAEIYSESSDFDNSDVATDGSNFYIVGESASTAQQSGAAPIGSVAIGALPTPTSTRLIKIAPTGEQIWFNRFGDDANACLAYDPIENRLMMVDGDTGAKIFNTLTGALTSTITPQNLTYTNCFADGAGGFVLTDTLSLGGTINIVRVQSDLIGEDYAITSTTMHALFGSGNSGVSNLAARFNLRDIRGITSAGGTVKIFEAGTLYSVTDGSLALNPGAHVIFGVHAGDNYFFADGVSAKYYDPFTNSIKDWVATAGTVPVGNRGERFRLIALWRARVIVSGMRSDPYNWFASKLGDPFNWDFSPATTTQLDAVAGTNSIAGKSPDIVTCLIPFSDDVLVLGGDHTIRQFSGDPLAGGRIDTITDRVGMAWGEPYAMDPQSRIYFFSNTGGLYRMEIGRQPVRISHAIEKRLSNINMATTITRMAWDDQLEGLHVFFTPLQSSTATTHYFWEARTEAWWPDVFGDNGYNPKAVDAFDGDAPGDRTILIGSRDGYIREYDLDANKDDAVAIESFVLIGPLVTRDLNELILDNVQAVLSEDSDRIEWEILVGSTAEKALTSTPVLSGVWQPGRNNTELIRRGAPGIYLKLKLKAINKTWAMETLRARLTDAGPVRQRLLMG